MQTQACVRCGSQQQLQSCNGGFICNACLERSQQGRDDTSRAAREFRYALYDQAKANELTNLGDDDKAVQYQLKAIEHRTKVKKLTNVGNKSKVSMGESVPLKGQPIVDTLLVPDKAALDASAQRIELLLNFGNDCTAMALDASNSIQAENSLEKMLAHQMAVAHKSALEISDKAYFQNDITEKVKLFNVSVRMMEVFQKGLLTLQKLRNGGEQNIVVQHVHVGDGGQAIVGNVRTQTGVNKNVS